VAKEAGGVYIGAEERTLAVGSSLLEVVAPGEGDPLYAFGAVAAYNLRGTLMRNNTGTIQAFVSSGANTFLTGTAQGDAGFNCTAGKSLHLGAAGKTSMVRVSELGAAVNGAAPVAKAAEIASPAETTAALKTAVDALRVAVKNFGITA